MSVSPDPRPSSVFSDAQQDACFSRIGDLFSASGMSVSELAQICALNETTVARCLAGKTKSPCFFTVCSIVMALGGDISAVLGLSDVEPDNPYRDLIEMYRADVARKNKRIDVLEHLLRRNLSITIITLVILALTVVFLICATAYDFSHPDRGWWRAVMGAFCGGFVAV